MAYWKFNGLLEINNKVNFLVEKINLSKTTSLSNLWHKKENRMQSTKLQSINNSHKTDKPM